MTTRHSLSSPGLHAQAGWGKVIVSATMSLDGFIADRNGSVARLYPDLEALRQTEVLQESIRTTGAVVMGRRAYAMGDPDSYFENLRAEPIELELTRLAETLGAIELRFRIES
jgi:dihydrofolate reductase